MSAPLDAPSQEPGLGNVGELLGDITRDLSTLMRQEVELAKAELRQSASRAGKGSGMLAGAGVGALMALIFLSVAAWWSIGNATGRGWSALIVTVIWLVIAAVLASLGRTALQSVQGLPKTADTVKKIPDAVKAMKEACDEQRPEVIRAQIEETRSNLSSDVNTLAETVKPGNVARRQVGKVKGAASSVKDKVMGAAPDLGSARDSTAGTLSNTRDSLGGAASSAQTAVKDAPDAVLSKTQGNPLAAGLIAFGAGWLAASLLPASSKEQELAQKAKDNASVITDELSNVAKEVGQNLKEPAQQAAESVKATAQDAAETVKSEGQSAAADVKEQSAEAKQTITEQH